MDLSGINHIAFLTSDLDRLTGFYEELFGAGKLLELPIPEPEGPGRHALIAVGAGATLHVFELAKVPPPVERPMFQRGRIDHFALNVANAETFERLRAAFDLTFRARLGRVLTRRSLPRRRNGRPLCAMERAIPRAPGRSPSHRDWDLSSGGGGERAG